VGREDERAARQREQVSNEGVAAAKTGHGFLSWKRPFETNPLYAGFKEFVEEKNPLFPGKKPLTPA
jgi:hypothetical protein